ncbi:hypothetical protein AB0I93_39215 [Streptomyces sp. NPDC049967]|uniref:hypothetical protein n=1 Tax=unclassified Streptomyces TaxID=2593676 RepID=UPI002E155264|nr:hypothetical protein OG384_14435 [Streptomyces sp. NBC_01324]
MQDVGSVTVFLLRAQSLVCGSETGNGGRVAVLHLVEQRRGDQVQAFGEQAAGDRGGRGGVRVGASAPTAAHRARPKPSAAACPAPAANPPRPSPADPTSTTSTEEPGIERDIQAHVKRLREQLKLR